MERFGLKQIFKDGFLYKKVGIILQGLHLENEETVRLYGENNYVKDKRLMAAMDKIAQRFGRDMVRFGVERNRDEWQMRREMLSRRFTTRFDEVLRIV